MPEERSDPSSPSNGSPSVQTTEFSKWWRGIDVHRRAIGVGGALVAVSPFLPWLHAQSFLGIGGGTYDLFSLTSALGRGGLPWLVVAVGAALAWIALARPTVSLRAVRDSAFVVGLIAVLLGAWPAIQAVSEASSAGVSVVEPGSLFCVAGVGVLMWGGVHGRPELNPTRSRPLTVDADGAYHVRLTCGHVVRVHADKTTLVHQRVRCPEHGPQRVVESV